MTVTWAKAKPTASLRSKFSYNSAYCPRFGPK